MFSVVVSILLFCVIFLFLRFTVSPVLLISNDIVVRSSSISLSSIDKLPPALSFRNHVILLLYSLRFRVFPDSHRIIIVMPPGPDGGFHIAGFCLGSRSPKFGIGIGVVVSFVAGGIQNMSLPRVGDTS